SLHYALTGPQPRMLRDLTLVLPTLGFLAGMAATCLGVLVVALWNTRWDAVEAIGTIFAGLATVAAVIVALLPIWRAGRERDAQAEILRRQVQNHLSMLIEAIDAIVANPTGPYQIPLFQGLLADTAALEALFPQSHLFDAVPFNALVELN